MRSKLSFILLLAIFGLAMTDTLRQKKIDIIAKAIKEVHDRSIKRKLQGTDNANTNSTSEEGKRADDPAEEIPANAPVSKTTPPQTNNPNAGIQIMKFHNFKAVGKKIQFGVFFFFFKRPIPLQVIIRLRVTSNSRRMRNLENEQAESVPSTCELKDKSLVDKIDETGEKFDYDCNAVTKNLDASKANITLNTDVPMTVKDSKGVSTSVDFNDVNFKGNSSEQASSLQEVEDEDPNNQINLKDVDIEGGNANEFTLKGTVEPAGGLKTGDSFDITVPNEGQDEPATVTCEVQSVVGGEVTMQCKSDTDLKSKMSNFHNVATTVKGKPLDISVKDGMKNEHTVQTGKYYDPANNGNTNRYYRKSSGGLSGGAIAGIVIACVVVLAAASIAAIMLRKPSPPIDNTTVVGLKTADNI